MSRSPVWPIRCPELHADVERWAEKLLSETGSASVIVEFNVKERRFIGYRLGGAVSRKDLTDEVNGRID